MSYEVIATEPFERKLKRLAKKYRSLRDDLMPIVEQLAINPKLGTLISQDCYKIRFAISSKGKGKSGGGRLITYVKIVKNSIALALLTACQPDNNNKDQLPASEEDRRQLRHLKEVEWPKAYREQDTVLLDLILGEDFQMIDADGNWSDKKFELDWLKKNAVAHDSFFYEIKRLDFPANGTAIIAGTGHITNDSVKTIYQSSNVLVKRNGVWKAVASHVSGVRALE